ncbi:MAG TPA: hypothetical protein VKJ47_14245 [Candidatus Binatia bacterium]|nr:hypothetical protein [Candidatus Binatia bacterium]
MRKPYSALAVVLIVMTETSLPAQDVDKCAVKLNPSTTLRNTVVTITVANLEDGVQGTLQLKSLGGTVSQHKPVSVTSSNGTIEYRVPDDFQLGQYSVTLAFKNLLFPACERLTIVPALKREPKLSPFEPNATYDTETVWVPDSQGATKSKALPTVHLTLRGGGFLGEPYTDNQVLINGDEQQVIWDGCTDQAGTPNEPKVNQICGSVISSERIDLWRVPVPPDGVMRVAVRQGDKMTEPQRFTVYRWSTWSVALISAVIALCLAAVVVVLVYLLTRKQPKESRYNPLKVLFLDLETDTYSLSKFQFYWWTVAALFGYAYLVISKVLIQGEPWPDIPGTLPGIVAIGAGTSVGAQFVTNVRGPKGAGAEEPSLGDLVTSGGVAAPERVQMLVWTIFGVGAFCLAVLQHAPGTIRELDAVPSGMLYMMGLSSIGYLGGKLARKPGPIINEISITPAEGDDALASAAAPPPPGPPDLSRPAAKAQEEVARSFANVPAGGSAEKAVQALSDGITAASQVKTTAEAEAVMKKLTILRSQAEAAAKAAADQFAQPAAPSGAGREAEIAQLAAATLQEFSDQVSAAVGLVQAPATPGVAAGPKFTRVIELRGRNLSSEALIEIDGTELPFRMLRLNGEGKRRPEVVIREPDDQTPARVLRLSIDPGQLEKPDFEAYKHWFGTSDSKKQKTFTLVNPDGQKADISFTVPPAAAQSSTKTGQESSGSASQPQAAGTDQNKGA